MTSRMYEEHFEHQILGLLHLTRKIKNAWFANEGVLDLDEMIQKLIEYHDINTYKLFNHCFGPMSSSFKTLPTTQQQKIIKFCGDIDLYVSFVNLLNSNDSGLKYLDLVEGTGDVPKPGDTVRVHYTGWLDDFNSEKKFDSSYDRRSPLVFKVESRNH